MPPLSFNVVFSFLRDPSDGAAPILYATTQQLSTELRATSKLCNTLKENLLNLADAPRYSSHLTQFDAC
jgi:hypothetical protein